MKPDTVYPRTLPAANASVFILEPFHLYFPHMAPACLSSGILTSLGAPGSDKELGRRGCWCARWCAPEPTLQATSFSASKREVSAAQPVSP